MSHKFEGLLAPGNGFDDTDNWYSSIYGTGGDQFEATSAAAIGLSIAIDKLDRGDSLKFISEDVNVTIPGRGTRLSKKDMQTFEESDTIPFNPNTLAWQSQQHRRDKLINQLATRVRKLID